MARIDHLDMPKYPNYTWRSMPEMHLARQVRSVRCGRCVEFGHVRYVRSGVSGMADLTCLNRDKTRPCLGRGKPEQRQEKTQKRHPLYTHTCTHMYTTWHPCTPPCTRVHPAHHAGHGYTGHHADAPGRTPDQAMGLTLRNFRYCTCPIQGRVLERL